MSRRCAQSTERAPFPATPDDWYVTTRQRLPAGTGASATQPDSRSEGRPSPASLPHGASARISSSSAYMHLSAHLLGFGAPCPCPWTGALPARRLRRPFADTPAPAPGAPLSVPGAVLIDDVDAGRANGTPESAPRSGRYAASPPRRGSGSGAGAPPPASASSSDGPSVRPAKRSRLRDESIRCARRCVHGQDRSGAGRARRTRRTYAFLLLDRLPYAAIVSAHVRLTRGDGRACCLRDSWDATGGDLYCARRSAIVDIADQR
jgi:hypothetical protein